jgi:hypothetical protein
VVGALVEFDGTVPSAARVYLIEADGSVAISGSTDSQGAFALAPTRAGSWNFVAVADDGHAAQGLWELQAKGTTDVGSVFLLSAAETPGLVDLRGLGLEEQHSSFAQGTTWSVRPWAGGAIVGTEDGVMQVPPTGAPQRLSTDPWPVVGMSTVAGVGADLVGDCWATSWMSSMPEGFDDPTKIDTFVLYDLERQREIVREHIAPSDPTGPRVLGAGCSDVAAMAVIGNYSGTSRTVALWIARGSDAVQTTDLGPTSSTYDPVASLFGDFLVIPLPTPDNLGLVEVLWRLGESTPRTLDGWVSGAVQGQLLLARGDPTSWVLYDPESGAEKTVLAQPDFRPDHRGQVLLDAATQTLWYAQYQSASSILPIMKIDLVTGSSTEVELPAEVQALLGACSWTAGGDTPCFLEGDDLLVQRIPNGWPSPSGVIVDLRTGDHWTFDWPSATSQAFAMHSLRGTLFLWLTDTLGGDTAIYTGAQRSPLRRRTFMPAYKGSSSFDTSGLWYIRPDPRTFVYQLFFLEDDGR